MKNIKIINVILLILLLAFLSCEQSIEGVGYENDPDQVNDAPAPTLQGKAELVVSYLTGSDASRYAGINSGYLSGLANQWIGINDYSYVPNDFDRLWTNIYVEGIKSAKIVKSKAITSGNLELLGSAQLLEALFFGEAAASFGNIPFDDVFVAGVDNPTYENQVTVLQKVLSLLDEAIANAGSNNLFFNDGIGGLKTNSGVAEIAHSLKARYYLILKDYSNALAEAQQGITSSSNDLITIHEDNPGSLNFYFDFLVNQRAGDTGATGSHLEALLNSSNGSVVRDLVTPGDDDRYNFYYSSTSNFNTNAGGIFDPGASLPVISWYETKLIEAEAAQRTGNNSVALNALNAVRSELTTQFGGSFPASTASGSTLLKHIIEEKYITLFPSVQTFHDVTRTDNAIGINPNSGTQLPERFLYAQGEIDVNTSVPDPIPSVFAATEVNN